MLFTNKERWETTTRNSQGCLILGGKAKWEAWNAVKGKSKDDAQKEYVAMTKNLLAKYGFNDLANGL